MSRDGGGGIPRYVAAHDPFARAKRTGTFSSEWGRALWAGFFVNVAVA